MDADTNEVIRHVEASGPDSRNTLQQVPSPALGSLPVRKNTVRISIPAVEDSPKTSTRSSTKKNQVIPFWLRRTTRLAFSVLFMSLWVALLVIWHFNKHSDGFHLALTSNYLSWTYGPTAVFIIIVSLWRQVDYYAKLSQPWKVLLDDFSCADKTILLDYLWPLQINSLIAATKNRHLVVVASILVFGILKFVTLISTGLFVTRMLQVQMPTQVGLQSTFDGTDFWSQISNEGPTYFLTNDDWISPVLGDISSTFMFNFVGSLEDPSFRRSEILGSNAVQGFYTPPDTPFSSIRANTSVVIPHVSCEPANLEQVQYLPGGSSVYLRLKSDTCPSYESNETQKNQVNDGIGVIDHYIPEPVNNLSTSYRSWRINCLLSGNGTSQQDVTLHGTTPSDMRIAIAQLNYTNVTADAVSYMYLFGQSVYYNTSDALYVLQGAKAVICKVGYSLQDALISKSHGTYSDLTAAAKTNITKHFQDLSNLQLTEVLWAAMMNNSGSRLGLLTNTPSYENEVPFQLVRHYLDKVFGAGTALDTQSMLQGFSGVLAGLTARFMVDSYSSPSSAKIDAVGVLEEDRLYVNAIVLGFMVAALIVTMILSLAMALDKPHAMNFLQQGQIAGLATVLASNESLQQLLQPLSSLSMKSVRQYLVPRNFRMTQCNGRVSIDSAESDIIKIEAESTRQLSFRKSWEPLMARWYMLVLTFSLPLVAIVVLEVLSQISNKHHGLLYVASPGSLSTYLIRYTSVLIVFLMATLFNSLDFTIATFTPFSALSRKSMPVQICLHSSPLDLMPPIALLQALKNRRLGSAASLLGALLGSVLTIIVSGLWVVRDSTASYQVHINRSSLWNADSWQASIYTDAGFNRLQTIRQGGVIPLAKTWMDFVLPDLEDLQIPKTLRALPYQGNFTFVLPALRPRLDCIAVSRDQMMVTFESQPSEYVNDYNPVINMRLLVNDRCYSKDGWKSYDFPRLINNSSYRSFRANMFILQHPGPSLKFQCPTLAAALVYVSGKSPLSPQALLQNTTFMYCFQKLQQVQLTTTFIGDPSVPKLDPSSPPSPDESSDFYLGHGPDPQDSNVGFNFADISRNIMPLILPDADKYGYADPTFSYIFYGNDSTDPVRLVGETNEPLLISKVQDMYREIMVPMLDAGFRVPVDPLTANPNDTRLEGTMQLQRSRLAISNTSKLTLQIMLASMSVLGILSWMLTPLRGVLPRNPSSIASTMAFLSGSKLCSREFIPEGAEAMNKRDIRDVFKGQKVSLGWSRTAGSPPPGSISSREEQSIGEGEGASTVIDNSAQVASSHDSENLVLRGGDVRFGIDLGTPDTFGFQEGRGWSLTRRRPATKVNTAEPAHTAESAMLPPDQHLPSPPGERRQ